MLERFKYKKGITHLESNIYLFKDFFEKDKIDYINLKISELDTSDWFKHENVTPGDISGQYLDGKLSLDIIDQDFHDSLINFFAPELWIFSHGNILKIESGESSTTEHSLSDRMEYYKEIIPYKIAVYLSDFGGGEIVFPNIGFEYKPEAGDLLIFKSGIEYEHYTKEVTSGTRYVYMDYLIKHPQYFMP
jgi:hypothetical protein